MRARVYACVLVCQSASLCRFTLCHFVSLCDCLCRVTMFVCEKKKCVHVCTCVMCVCVYVGVCVFERKRERERECVCGRESEKER